MTAPPHLSHPPSQAPRAAVPPPPRHQAPPAPTWRQTFDAAIARIPTYRPGLARWVVSTDYGHWGTTDWATDTVYVSPAVPQDLIYDVVVHEWSHVISVLPYDGDANAAVDAMNAWFGGTGLTGAERAADCMARLQHATWTHYTTCTDQHWRAGAARLLSGRRL